MGSDSIDRWLSIESDPIDLWKIQVTIESAGSQFEAAELTGGSGLAARHNQGVIFSESACTLVCGNGYDLLFGMSILYLMRYIFPYGL
jgi:hypothetical protein